MYMYLIRFQYRTGVCFIIILFLVFPNRIFTVVLQVGSAIDHRRHGHEQRQEGLDREQFDDDDVYRVQRAGSPVVQLLSKSHAERSTGKSGLKMKKKKKFVSYCSP